MNDHMNAAGLPQIDNGVEKKLEPQATIAPVPGSVQTQKPSSGRKSLWLLVGLGALMLGAGGAYATLAILHKPVSQQQTATVKSAVTTTVSTGGAASSNGTNNSNGSSAAITSDLQAADTGLGQVTTDQAGADTNLNDASQQISVPSN